MHEYLSHNNLSYYDCIACSKRTPHVCITCHHCYSCHPKIETIEKEVDLKKRYIHKMQKPTSLVHSKSNKKYI